jgi:hypothetical protein
MSLQPPLKPPEVFVSYSSKDKKLILCKHSQLAQTDGDAALVAKFLLDLQALVVELPRLG